MTNSQMQTPEEKLRHAEEAVERGLQLARIKCVPYSLEDLMEMAKKGKNPILGDRP